MKKIIIYQTLEESFYKNHGSEYIFYKNEYIYKDTGSDFWGLTWSEVSVDNGYKFDPIFFYVSKPIEDFFYNNFDKSTIRYKLDNPTIQNFWREIIVNPNGIYSKKNNFQFSEKYICKNLADVEKLATYFYELLSFDFMEYSKRFDSLEKIDTELNSNTIDRLVYDTDPKLIKIRGLVAAKLTNSIYFDKLAILYKKQILTMGIGNNLDKIKFIINALNKLGIDTSDIRALGNPR